MRNQSPASAVAASRECGDKGVAMAIRWMACLAFVLAGADALAQVIAVPPAAHRANPAAKSEPVPALLTPAAAPASTIALPAPSATEKARLSAVGKSSAAGAAAGALLAKRQARVVGFARAMPDGERPLSTSTLPWHALADGGMATRVNVTSPGAAAIRIGVMLSKTHPNVALRFAGAGDPQHVFGPFTANEVAASRVFWSPVLEGDSATVVS